MIRRPHLPDFPIRWRLIQDRPRSPVENMAIDEMLLRDLEFGDGMPTLRTYRWDRDTISLGHNQDPYEVLNVEECLDWGIPWVKRATGGKAVFHGQDLTYAVVTYKHDLSTPRLLFEKINTVWTIALQKLGLDAYMSAESSSGNGTPDCFSTCAVHEVMLDNGKIIGSAQRTMQNTVLQHGSLLSNRDTHHIARFLSEDLPPPIHGDSAAAYWSPTIYQQAEALFVTEFGNEFDAILIPSQFTDEEEARIRDMRMATMA